MNLALARYVASPAGVKGGSGLGCPPRSSGLTSPLGCMNGAGFQIPVRSCASKAPDLASDFFAAMPERSVCARATARKASAAARAIAETVRRLCILCLFRRHGVATDSGLETRIARSTCHPYFQDSPLLLLLRLFAERAARQLCAVGKHGLAQHSHRRVPFAGNESDRDLVAGVQRFARPTGPLEHRRREGLDRPVYDLPRIVLRVQKNLAMRVGPKEFRHCSLQRLGMLNVVIRSPMMREYRNADHQ